MKYLMAKLLGLEPSQFASAHWSNLSVRFAGLPRSWWALATILLVGILVWVTLRNYRRESKSASHTMKMALAALRLGALAVIMLALFQPLLVIDKSSHLLSSVAVLVDDSLSMSLADRYSDADFARRLALALGISPSEKNYSLSRLDMVRTMLGKSDNVWLKELARNHDLKIMAFSDAVKRLEIGDLHAEAGTAPKMFFDPSRLQAGGVATDIEMGLRQALSGSRGQQLAAVALLTDGQANAGDAMTAARLLVAKNIPIFAVGLGSAEPPKNIDVQALRANDVIFKDDEAVFIVRLTANGFEGRTVQLVLREREQGNTAAGEVVASQAVTLGADGAIQEIPFRMRPPRVGLFIFSAEIEPQAGELTGKDNTASIAVRIIDQKVRVLFVSGDSGREYRYLKSFLIRDKAFAAQVWLQNASRDFVQESSNGESPLTKLPRVGAELFTYDVIILYDPIPGDFDGAWLRLLKQFVEDRGGGLCFIAGNKYTEESLLTRLNFQSLAAILPVTIARDSLTFREGISRIHREQWPLIVTPQGLDHPAFQFDTDPQRNRNLWSVMPGFYWSQPVARAKPGAAILAVHSDPRRGIDSGPMPVIAAQFYGMGQVLFLGMDSTWRWRYVGSRYFEQFWGQTVRYLSQGRLLGGRKRVEFFTDKETYDLGQRAVITAKVFAADFTPAKLEKFEIALRGDDGLQIPLILLALPGNPGQLEASTLLEKQGLYEIVARTGDVELAKHAASKNFRVVLPRLEFQQPRMNRALLSDLARMTGGKFLAADEFEKLPSLVPAHGQILINEVTQDLWDTPLMLLVFCALLFTEWSLRKWKNMT